MNEIIQDPKRRVKAAWIIFWLSCIGWPVSAFTFASSEPKAILGLSWGAMIITALNIVATCDVRKEQDDDGNAA